MAPLYLDDLEVGQRFRTAEFEMDAASIKAFAAAFDPQPFHLDDAAAEASLFHGLAASGWHTAAVSMRQLVTGGLPIAGGMVGLGGEIAWPHPTRPGDRLRVESEIVEIIPSRSKLKQGIVRVRSVTLNQKDEIVQVFTAKILAYRRGTTPSVPSLESRGSRRLPGGRNRRGPSEAEHRLGAKGPPSRCEHKRGARHSRAGARANQ